MDNKNVYLSENGYMNYILMKYYTAVKNSSEVHVSI